MRPPPDRYVDITEKGRYGSVVYREPGNVLSFYWEFGGGDAVANIQVEDAETWKPGPTWAEGRHGEILRFVADEVIRQKAPNCRAEIDEAAGVILLRHGDVTAGPRHRPETSWVQRYTNLKMKLGLVVLVLALIVAGMMWFKNKVLVIDPGKGMPFGLSVRTDDHIATLIQTLVPYTPSLNRDHSQDEYRMSLLLVPTDVSASPRMVPITGALSSSSLRLAKILGSDGRTVWYAVNGIGGVVPRTGERVTADELRKANPTLDGNWLEDTRGMEVDRRLRLTARDRSQVFEVDPETHRAVPVQSPAPSNASPFASSPAGYLCAGFFTGPNEWLGLHSTTEVERQFKPKSWLRRIEGADDAKEPRRFHRGVLDPDSRDRSHKVISMTALGSEEYLNAAFLRLDDRSEPLRLSDPDGALIVYTSAPGLKGTLVVARVGTDSRVVWKADTGIDRSNLSQILPGERSMAFVGTRPMVPGKVSEPLLVIIDNLVGTVTTTSLWQ